ncbi:MAG: hypothetical protein JNL51_16805 [Chitinophagaceae bacterium]|nr:hypothetical protein [Chitinophagaceae bacterium]
MKKILLSFLLMTFGMAALHAQSNDVAIKKDIKSINRQEKALKKEKKEYHKKLVKLESKEVSYQSKQQFNSDFRDASAVTWKRTNYFDEASFTKDGVRMTAYYDNESNLVGTTTAKTANDIPAAALKEISKKYKDYTIQSVMLFDDNEFNETDMLLYDTQFDDADNYFVEMKKGADELILKVDMQGNVSYFKEIKAK